MKGREGSESESEKGMWLARNDIGVRHNIMSYMDIHVHVHTVCVDGEKEGECVL